MISSGDRCGITIKSHPTATLFFFTLPLHASPRLGRDPATDELSAFEAPPSVPFHMSMDEIKWSWTIEREDERNEMWTSKLHMRHVQENRKYCNRGVDWAAADVADGTKSDMLFPVCGIASQREQKGSGSTARKLIKKKKPCSWAADCSMRPFHTVRVAAFSLLTSRVPNYTIILMGCR